MRKTNDRMLARVVAGSGAIPLPRWLNRLLRRVEPNPPRIDLTRMTDTELARMGLTRHEVVQASGMFQANEDWNPPAYWMIWPGRSTRRPCWRDQLPYR